jgi:hypothetical protein
MHRISSGYCSKLIVSSRFFCGSYNKSGVILRIATRYAIALLCKKLQIIIKTQWIHTVCKNFQVILIRILKYIWHRI